MPFFRILLERISAGWNHHKSSLRDGRWPKVPAAAALEWPPEGWLGNPVARACSEMAGSTTGSSPGGDGLPAMTDSVDRIMIPLKRNSLWRRCPGVRGQAVLAISPPDHSRDYRGETAKRLAPAASAS